MTSQLFMEKVYELERKHGTRFYDLSDSHPDVQLLHTLAKGLSKEPYKPRKPRVVSVWTDEHISYLKKYSEVSTIKELASATGHDYRSTRWKVNALGLKTKKRNRDVIALDENGVVVQEFRSVYKARRELGGSEYVIDKACQTGKFYNGYYWKYKVYN